MITKVTYRAIIFSSLFFLVGFGGNEGKGKPWMPMDTLRELTGLLALTEFCFRHDFYTIEENVRDRRNIQQAISFWTMSQEGIDEYKGYALKELSKNKTIPEIKKHCKYEQRHLYTLRS